MAILGLEGRVQFVREAPAAVTFTPSDLRPAKQALDAVSPAFWTGDCVTLSAALGVPTVETPLGTAQWGGVGPYERGVTRLHVADDPDQFWKDDDGAAHWEEATPAFVTEASYWVHVDELDRISFYETQDDAFLGLASARVPILQVNWQEMSMAACSAPDADEEDWFARQWSFTCGLRAWSLETNAAAVDVTPIGVKFGEAVKSLVTGGGSLDFLIERTPSWDGLDTMRLALLTEKGSKARAQFFLTTGDDDCLAPRSVFYEADILVTACSVSLRLEDAIAGSAQFGTTGPISLRVAPALG